MLIQGTQLDLPLLSQVQYQGTRLEEEQLGLELVSVWEVVIDITASGFLPATLQCQASFVTLSPSHCNLFKFIYIIYIT